MRRDRRLRALVLHARGCLGALPRRQRRVLILRAGIGHRAPLPRRRVAHALRVSVRAVARSERKGLRALRRIVRSGGCPARAAGASGGGFRAPGRAATERVVAATGGTRGTAPSAAAAGGDARRVSVQRVGAKPSGLAGDRAGVAGAAAIHETGGSFDPVIPLLLAALAASALLIGRRLRPAPARVPGRRKWPPLDDG